MLFELLRQGLGFALVGLLGACVHGLVFSFLSRYRQFDRSPFPNGFLKRINYAWIVGFLCAASSNFVLDKFVVFSGA